MPSLHDATMRLFNRINLACAILGASILFLIAATVVFEVFARALTGSSRLWVIEVSEYALLFITFLGAPYLLEKNMHVVLDLVVNNLPRGPRTILRLVNALIGLAVCAILTAVGIGVVLDQFSTGVREITVMAPRSWWITASLPLGAFLMAVQFLDQALRAVSGRGV
jgi:C4-dicarboxylate transporter, DctQ subunit